MKILILMLLFSKPAMACGPWGCYSKACLTYGANSLERPDLDLCGQDQVNHLDPNNLTESNFAILADELTGLSGESEPFSSSDEVEEKATLPPEANRDDYWNGVAAFRADDYIKAAEFFKKRSKVADRDAQTSAYLMARSYLRAAQINYDGYRRETVDASLALRARDAFREFIKNHPGHEWASSARGLIRRAEFLAQDLTGYNTDWSQAVDEQLAARPRSYRQLAALFQEAAWIDLKVMTEAKALHPILWMIRVYYVTRQLPNGPAASSNFNLSDQLVALEADKGSFKKYPDLFAWSRAVLLLKLDRAQEAANLLQNLSVAKTNSGSLSWVVLNARIEMALGQFDKARTRIEAFIKQHPLQAEKAKSPSKLRAHYNIGPHFADENLKQDEAVDARNFYAMTYHWEGKAAAIATQKSLELLTAEPLKRVYIQAVRPEEMLVTLAQTDLSKNVRALLEPLIMAKLIVTNQWSLAASAYKSLRTQSTKKEFRLVAKAAEILAQNPADAEANARIGLFISQLDPDPRVFSTCEKQSFGPITESLDFYLRALDGFKAKESSKKNPLEATLLRAMLACFKDHHGVPYCGPKANKWDSQNSIPTEIRAQWFKRLKSRFPDSPEAKAQKIYW